MKLLRRWWFWVTVIVVLIVGAVVMFGSSNDVSYVTELVEREDLVQTVDANGEVVSLDEVDLSFDLSGTVESLLVSVGDTVGVGDLLAVLETDELIANVQSAYQAVQVAQGNLDAQQAGASDEQIAVSQAGLSAAELDYAQAIASSDVVEALYQTEAQVKAASLAAAQDNVSQTIADNATMIVDAYDDLLGAAWAGVVEARSGLAKGDEVLGIRNSTLNDDYDDLLSSGDRAAIEAAQTAYYAAEASVSAAETAILVADYGVSGPIVTAAEEVEDALSDIAALMVYLRRAVMKMPATGDLSVTEATALAASIDATRAAVQLDQAALQNGFQTVSDALTTSSANLEDANHALAQAQSTYDAALLTTQYQALLSDQAIDSADAVVTLREAELAATEAEPRVVDLAAFEAEVARAQAAYASAQARLNKAEIRSPIVGDVTDVVVEVGEQVIAASAVVTVQTTQEQFEVVADVSESDIAKLTVGGTAEMTFDAFGSDDGTTGVIRTIDPAEKEIENVVYYEVTVAIDAQDVSLALRPGLSVDLIFTTQERDAALTVSQRALKTREDGSFYVRVLDGSSIEERDVEVGLRGDLGRIEIVSGLSEGEEIVIREVAS